MSSIISRHLPSNHHLHLDGVLQCIYQMVGREDEKEGKGERGKEGVKEREGQPVDLARYEELMKSCW
jgi:hypothetical protein